MAAHNILFLDAETYYDNDYTLRKMSPPNYILDPRFELIMVAVKEGSGKPYIVDGPDFPEFLRGLDAANTTTVTFNSLFDNCIFAWRYNFIPSRMLCAMRMAVALRGHVLQGASLASVGSCLGVGCKGTTIENVKGMRRSDIIARPDLWFQFKDYALNDVQMCADIYDKLSPEFPVSERRVMDRVLR